MSGVARQVDNRPNDFVAPSLWNAPLGALSPSFSAAPRRDPPAPTRVFACAFPSVSSSRSQTQTHTVWKA